MRKYLDLKARVTVLSCVELRFISKELCNLFVVVFL